MAVNIKSATIGLALGLVSSTAMAGTWSIGAGVLAQSTPYKGFKSSDYLTPVPFVNYDSDNFYFHTLSAGYYLWNDPTDKLSIDAYYSPQAFRPKDSDDAAMKKLDRRRDTVMAGLTYSHIAEWGPLRTIVSGDILGVSKGLRGDVAYLYNFTGDNWTLQPGIGIVWNSKKQNQYEYGISEKESRNSGLARYKPSDSWTPYLELSANYRFNENWSAFGMGRIDSLPSEVKDSPMVNKSVSGIILTGVTYTF